MPGYFSPDNDDSSSSMTAAAGARHRRSQQRQEHSRSSQATVSNHRDDGLQVADPHGDEGGSNAGSQDGEQDQEDQDSEDDKDEDDEEEEDGEEDDEDDDDDDDDEEEEEEEGEEEDGAGDGEDDEDDSPFRFLERLDPNWLTRKSHTSASHALTSANQTGSDNRSPAAGADDAEFYGAMIQMLTHVLGSSDSISWPNQPTPGSQLAPSPFAHTYSSPAQTPSHAAGSLSTYPRPGTSGGNRGNKSELSALQPMIQALIARLGKDHQLPRRPVGEQDLTALLQTLMEQQQRQQDQQTQKPGVSNQATNSYTASGFAYPQQGPLAPPSSSRSSTQLGQAGNSYNLSTYQPLNFADLDFEDEDEDDPDFNPDLNPDLPLPSAWSLAVRDVVASEESRAAAAAAAAAVAASHSGTPSGTQTPADGLRPDTYRPTTLQATARSPTHTISEGQETRRTSLQEHTTSSALPPQTQQIETESTLPRKRGRKPVLEPGEAQRRRAQRNIEYQRMRRQAKKIEESEQSETVLELKAEVKMLRAEMERLRDENVMLRAQRELDRLQRSNHG